MKYILFFILPFLLVEVKAQKIWTLQECIDTAIMNNRNIKQQSITNESRQIAFNQARLNILPSINGSAGQSYSTGYYIGLDNVKKNNDSWESSSSLGLSANMNLFNGLKNKYTIDVRKIDLQASQADMEKLVYDISIQVSNAFLEVLLNKELLEISNEQLSLTSTKIEQQKLLIENGKLAEGELYEFLAQQAKEELAKIRRENSLKLSLLDLAQLLEIDDFENLQVAASDEEMSAELTSFTVESLYKNALAHRPEIKAAELRLKSSERNTALTRADIYPNLTLSGSMGTAYSNEDKKRNMNTQFKDNLSKSVDLRLQVPIFNRFDVKNRISLAKLDVSSKKLEVENTKLLLQKEIRQVYQNALAAKARFDAAQKSQAAAQEAFRFTSQKFEVGRATSYEMYQAKNNLTQVLSEEVQAKYEYIFSMKLIEYFK